MSVKYALALAVVRAKGWETQAERLATRKHLPRRTHTIAPKQHLILLAAQALRRNSAPSEETSALAEDIIRRAQSIYGGSR